MVGLAMGMGSMLGPEISEETTGNKLSDTKLGKGEGEGTGSKAYLWGNREGNEETHLYPAVPEAPF